MRSLHKEVSRWIDDEFNEHPDESNLGGLLGYYTRSRGDAVYYWEDEIESNSDEMFWVSEKDGWEDSGGHPLSSGYSNYIRHWVRDALKAPRGRTKK
jgi:hypothetical protein